MQPARGQRQRLRRNQTTDKATASFEVVSFGCFSLVWCVVFLLVRSGSGNLNAKNNTIFDLLLFSPLCFWLTDGYVCGDNDGGLDDDDDAIAADVAGGIHDDNDDAGIQLAATKMRRVADLQCAARQEIKIVNKWHKYIYRKKEMEMQNEVKIVCAYLARALSE